jgi:hypothetical protein
MHVGTNRPLDARLSPRSRLPTPFGSDLRADNNDNAQGYGGTNLGWPVEPGQRTTTITRRDVATDESFETSIRTNAVGMPPFCRTCYGYFDGSRTPLVRSSRGLPLRYHAVMFARVGLLGAVVLLGGTIGAPLTASFDMDGHQSSLRARVTMSDGTSRRITLQGVGCAQGMCSRVRVSDAKTGGVWLDGLASVHDISQIAEGPVHAVFTFKNGSSRETSITAFNRVLYIGSRFRTHRLDLSRVKQIEFE